MADDQGTANALGPNEWLVDEMYEQYLADPNSVSRSWQEFFADYRRDQHEPVAASPKAAPTPTATPAPAPAPAPAAEPNAAPPSKQAEADEEARPLRGAAARIVANM